ncbi:unnamed protein product [Peronospora farinosa]|uniref:Retroviral polymerase SH3-like domain-containing protein n=1 Tax=Peronospora farinosa TaxID=134698 RepID=A0AAV0T9D0_9STRA|nr:unnamed protein product [Peronospora farinosa]
MLTVKCPNLVNIIIFGSLCTVYRDPDKKLWHPRAKVGMIIGKNDEIKGFKVYNPNDRVVITTQHIKNVETIGSTHNVQLQAQLLKEDPEFWKSINEFEAVVSPKESTLGNTGNKSEESLIQKEISLQLILQRLQRLATARMHSRYVEKKHVPIGIVNDLVTVDPKNYQEAMKDKHADKWKDAMKVELEALENNHTWKVVAKPHSGKLLHTKWVLRPRNTPMESWSAIKAYSWPVKASRYLAWITRTLMTFGNR